jgi:hypothetical protein
MSFDSSTNVDIDLCVKDQCNATKSETDLDKHFSRDTVRRQDRAYLRVLHPCDAQGAPLPDCVGGPPHLRARCWQDHRQCLGVATDVVWQADGKAVQGVGERKKIRSGHRFVATGGQGGHRRRYHEDSEPKWLHPDAKSARATRIARSAQRAAAV